MPPELFHCMLPYSSTKAILLACGKLAGQGEGFSIAWHAIFFFLLKIKETAAIHQFKHLLEIYFCQIIGIPRFESHVRQGSDSVTNWGLVMSYSCYLLLPYSFPPLFQANWRNQKGAGQQFVLNFEWRRWEQSVIDPFTCRDKGLSPQSLTLRQLQLLFH